MADKTRDGKTAAEALQLALTAMYGDDTLTAALRFGCLADLQTEIEKALVAARKQEETEAKLALSNAKQALVDANQRMRAIGLAKPKIGRPEGSRNKKTAEVRNLNKDDLGTGSRAEVKA